MKSLLSIPLFFLLFFTVSCKKTSTDELSERADAAAALHLQGIFTGIGSEMVSGQAKIYLQNGKYFLALENFATSNGPDLKVYLSEQMQPSNFIKLGDLKSTNGHQLYDIPAVPDFAKHKYVLIHCERYNHLFGSAELK